MYPRIRDFINLQNVMGNRYGVEIEMEGDYLPNIEANALWIKTRDGSLRGNSCEYVLKQPSYLPVVEKAIKSIIKLLEKYGRLNISDRCGIHIHTNVQNLRINELFNMLVLYFISEEVLIEKVSADRKGNLFCLSASQAEGLVDWLSRIAEQEGKGLAHMGQNELKYAALNVSSIPKFGTLEFRAVSTPKKITDLMKVMPLLEFFNILKAHARQYNHPEQIIIEFSNTGVKNFMAKHYHFLLDSDLSEQELVDRLMNGMRIAQDIAYAFPRKEKF